jgi:hypothetical protein
VHVGARDLWTWNYTVHHSEGWVQLKLGQGRKRREKEEEVGRWQLHSVSVKADCLDDTQGTTHYTLSNSRMPRRHYNSHICIPDRICIPSRPKKFLWYLVADYCLYDESHTFSQPSSGSWVNDIEQDRYNTKACSLRMFLQSWNRFGVWMNPNLVQKQS